ncbi:MAG TPA: polysaccharide deacetylase family protein [Gammaproteobacteria bacterium]|nr:polysaccharide deacetylase family protein [Gammaproteobacteria bacterium]
MKSKKQGYNLIQGLLRNSDSYTRLKAGRIAIGILVFLFCFNAYAESVAITMDDPNTLHTPLMSARERDNAILNTLNKNHLKIILFVHGDYVNSLEGKALLKRWNASGQTLGNHTYSHWDLEEVSLHDDESDFTRNEHMIAHYTHFQKVFRYPYLKEGDTVEKRDGFRAFLKAKHYRVGSVTIDASDWAISDRLERALAKNPKTNLIPYKNYYLAHIWNRAQYYDQLAISVLGRSPKHILLIHHNLLNALFLNDLIQMFKQHGWKVIDANNAYTDPVYQLVPKTLPAGESLIWALAKQTGKYDKQLRYPGEDESYETPGMDAAGL